MTGAAPIRIGVGGWTFAPWRGRFFPRGLPHDRELAHASSHLSSLEINGTFYRQQSPATFAAWRDETPDGFVFAVKAHRAATQSSDLHAMLSAAERFLGSGVAELGPKLGPILWQFAPTKRFASDAVEPFLAALPATLDGLELMHVVEARHPSFGDPAWIALARAYNVAVAIIESDKQALAGDVTAGFVYARLQRNDATEPDGYAAALLDAWAARLRRWSTGATVDDLPLLAPATSPRTLPCFAYFISGDKERAPDAATAMLARLGKTS